MLEDGKLRCIYMSLMFFKNESFFNIISKIHLRLINQSIENETKIKYKIILCCKHVFNQSLYSIYIYVQHFRDYSVHSVHLSGVL